MNTFEFSSKEKDIVLMSLIGRKRTIQTLMMVDSLPDNLRQDYVNEMVVVDSLLERFLPGCLSRINSAA